VLPGPSRDWCTRMNDFGAAVRGLMGERGLSQNQFAVLAHWDAGYLSKVLNGHKPGTHPLAADLDRALDAKGKLLDVWAAVHGSPALAALTASARPADLPHAAAGTLTRWDAVHEPAAVSVLAPGQAGPGEISHLEDTAAMFRTWDHQRGGGLGRQAAIGQLADVTELIGRPHPAPLRRRLLSVASMLTLTIASMSADTGDTATAYRYLGAALEAAREARNPELGARVANAIARRMLDDGNQQGRTRPAPPRPRDATRSVWGDDRAARHQRGVDKRDSRRLRADGAVPQPGRRKCRRPRQPVRSGRAGGHSRRLLRGIGHPTRFRASQLRRPCRAAHR
jgi:transcriptional regulator with XRE-family HTH domain